MTATATPAEVPTQVTDAIATELADVTVPTLTLGDLIRAGAAHTVKAEGWGQGDQACALSAAAIAAKSLGILDD